MFDAKELIRRLRPVIGKRADHIWQSYLASDQEERSLIKQSIEQLHTQIVDDYRDEKIILPPPNRFDHLHGQYPIGIIHYADKPLYPFALLERELTEHIGVFGRTGAGKTYFVLNLIKAHLSHQKPLLVFDWKDTYSICKTITSSQFRFNPLDVSQIPHKDQQAYLRQIIELFLDSYLTDLKLLTVGGVESLLLRVIDEFKPSTFADVLKYLKAVKCHSREYEWKATTQNLLTKMLNGPLGKIMNGQTVEIPWLTKQQMILSLSDIGNSSDKGFLIRTLLLRLYNHFSNQQPTKSLKLLIVLEESHHVLKKGSRETIIEVMLRQIREYGVGIVVVDQHPSLLSPPALAVYTTISFNLRLKADRDAIASALNLNRPEYLGRLPVQYCIIKLAGRYQMPFLLKTNDVKDVYANADILGGQQHSPIILTKESRSNDFLVILPNRISDAQNISKGQLKTMPVPQDAIGANKVIRVILQAMRKSDLSYEEAILVHTYIRPLLGTVERYKELGLSAYLGNKLKDQMLTNNLLKLESVPTKIGRTKLMVPTKDGFAFLQDQGFQVKGTDGIRHHYWKRRLKDQFERIGYSVKEEVHIEGKSAVDLLVTNVKSIAVEIETGTNTIEQIMVNIEKYSPVVSFILDTKKAAKIKAIAGDKIVAQTENACFVRVKEILGDVTSKR